MERTNELEQIRQAIKDLEWCDPDSGSAEYAKDVLIELIPKLIVSMSSLTWTRERPKVPGWYWWRDDTGEEDVVRVREALAVAGFIATNDEFYEAVDEMIGEWAGPIPHPEEPKG